MCDEGASGLETALNGSQSKLGGSEHGLGPALGPKFAQDGSHVVIDGPGREVQPVRYFPVVKAF